jgi:hypothetical protein
VVATIIMILASAIMPLAKVTAQRTREAGAAARRSAKCGRAIDSSRTPPISARSDRSI